MGILPSRPAPPPLWKVRPFFSFTHPLVHALALLRSGLISLSHLPYFHFPSSHLEKWQITLAHSFNHHPPNMSSDAASSSRTPDNQALAYPCRFEGCTKAFKRRDYRDVSLSPVKLRHRSRHVYHPCNADRSGALSETRIESCSPSTSSMRNMWKIVLSIGHSRAACKITFAIGSL